MDINSLIFGDQDDEGHYEFRRFKTFGVEKLEDSSDDEPPMLMLMKGLAGKKSIEKMKSWYVSSDRFDGVIFTPKVDVRIVGMGIYAPSDKKSTNFIINYKWSLERAPNGTTI